MRAIGGFAGVVIVLLLLAATQGTALADKPDHHTVSAHGWSGEVAAEVAIRDDDLVGRRIVKATYALYDGYEKTVLIPNGGSPLKAVDMANCHRDDLPSSPPWPCSPELHATEVIYGDTGGDPFGSPDHFHAGIQATETATGSGNYLTVGEIDHGGMVRITYQDGRGDVFTINFQKNEAVMIYRVVFERGKGYNAVILPLPARNF